MPVQQPPVIVLAGHPGVMGQGNGYGQPYPQQHMLPGPQSMGPGMPQERCYKVVGETEEWIEDYQ